MRTWSQPLIFICCILCINCAIDVTNAGGNARPSDPTPPPPSQPQENKNLAYQLGVMIGVPLLSLLCCYVCCCRTTGSENTNKVPRPPFCDSFLKTISLLFAFPLLYAAVRYKYVFSRVELLGFSSSGNGSVSCSVQYWNSPGITVRGEWTFLENNIDTKCCHPSSLKLTIDDKVYDDAWYLKGDNWVGDFCPDDLQHDNELPITFDWEYLVPAKFKAVNLGTYTLSSYVDASNRWWECTQEGPKLYYRLDFYKDGKVQCSRTITKVGAEPTYFNVTSLVIIILMTAILGFYAIWRAAVVCSAGEVQYEDDAEAIKNDYNRNL